MANIKVAVRVRPISTREFNVTGSEVIVRTDVKEISLTNLKVSSSKAGDSRERTRKYGFDYCFDSSNPEAENYADQTTIYETLGHSVLDALFSGYNTCLVAYGQSASGKTYTMMGPKDNPGLTPRLCKGLFTRIEEEEKKEKSYRISVSYLEIYNERVRDLLKPLTNTTGLRVREHPRLGPYVQGLTHQVVDTLGSLMSYVEEGTKARKTAPTLQNPSSSRSHALLTIAITASTDSPGTASGGHSGSSSSRRIASVPRGGSKLHLVDLAGSENAATCSGVHRLKEGANINKSLVALGNVISALAERGSNGNASSRRRFIPYRDSSLTWLLKDALGGNATTIMLATISPASGSYNETAHTLRFAQRAQSVVNRPVVNEDPVARIIRELRAEVARLKSLLLEKDINSGNKSICCCKYERDAEESENKELCHGRVPTKQEQLNNEDKREDTLQRTGIAQSIRRTSSCEFVQVRKHPSLELIKKASSYELLVPNDCFVIHRYKRAEVAELEHEDEEVIDEIIEPAFVDIPTLVAVLIKPDNNLQIGSAQIEEICSDEVLEDLVEGDFLETVDDHSIQKSPAFQSADRDHQDSLTDTERSSECIKVEEPIEDSKDISGSERNVVSERKKFQKQDSVDIVLPANLSNLENLKKFGSVDGLQKRSIPSLERSHTTLDKRSIILDKVKKLNNIKEREDQRVSLSSKLGSVWRTISNASSRENLHRKGSNDSDKSSKDSYNVAGTKGKILPRKTSLDGLKRKTSKDSSSSSSKDEQILFSNLTRDKLLRRKNSLDQDTAIVRAHTPIQRPNRRAQIVAAVTQRLYTNRKQGEDVPTTVAPASEIRSPPDLGTDSKTPNLAARMKLQDISRKMLGKRRRTCVDTQTDDQTLRVKDAVTLTDEPKIVRHEVGVLTDYHESCQDVTSRDDNPVLRVKEVATSTDVFRPQTKIIRCKDVECFVNDLDDEDYCSRNDSGILSDDTQNYAESNFSSAETSDLCPESDKRIVCAESSTNTVHSSSPKNMGVQTLRPEVKVAEEEQLKFLCSRPCCKPTTILESTPQNFVSGISPTTSDKSVISISVPDMISITIESSNLLESKIALSSSADAPEEKNTPVTRDSQVQTDKIVDFEHNDDHRVCFKDVSMRAAIVQTDSRTFRIENIFQDSKTSHKVDPNDEAFGGRTKIKKSIIFTNSLGTSIPSTRGIVTEDTVGNISKQCSGNQHESTKRNVMPAGLITDVFVSKRRTSHPKVSHPTICHNTCKYLNIGYPSGTVDNMTLNAPQDKPTHRGTYIDNTVNLDPTIVTISNCKQSLGTHSTSSGTLPFADNSNEKSTESGNLAHSPTVFKKADPLEVENNFSDDSLDYNEDSIADESCKVEEKKDCKCENYWPPDVVAHTKKETSNSYNDSNLNVTEVPLVKDFEDSQIEFPRIRPVNSIHSVPPSIDDYESLILGKHSSTASRNTFQNNSDSGITTIDTANSVGRKKVSFSHARIIGGNRENNDYAESEEDIKNSLLPKSIMKKESAVSRDRLEIIDSSNEETDDTSQGQSSLSSVSLSSLKLPRDNLSGKEDNVFDSESNDSCKSLQESESKKVRFVKNDLLEQCDSDSNSYDINFSEEEEDDKEEERGTDCVAKTKDDIVEEYFTEAVKFMRNMNSINEYMNAKNVFHKQLGCNKKRRLRRRKCPWRDHDYVEYKGQKISLNDDESEYFKNDIDDDILIPTKSYERCLQGIARLEACINQVSKHNDHLRDKYGIDVKSAGAKLALAGSSTDCKVRFPKKGHLIMTGNRVITSDVGISGNASKHSGLILHQRQAALVTTKDVKRNASLNRDDLDNKNNNIHLNHTDDLERKIFDQLMNVASSTQYRNSKKCWTNISQRVANFRPDNSLSYSKLRGNYNYARSESSKPSSFSDSEEDLQKDDHFSKVAYMESYPTEVSHHTAIQKSLSDTKLIRAKIARQINTLESSKEDSNLATCLPMTLDKKYSTPCTVTSERVRSTRRNIPLRIEKSSSTDTITTSTESYDGVLHSREKLRYPGSPRARFLELLNERRRIVECSRNASTS